LHHCPEFSIWHAKHEFEGIDMSDIQAAMAICPWGDQRNLAGAVESVAFTTDYEILMM
jgi:hypothetical protein